LSHQATDGKAVASPDWSPDNRVVIFSVTPRSGGFSQIYLSQLDTTGHESYPLFPQANPGRDPALSPDGKWVAFEGWPNTNGHDIWIATIGGLDPTQVTMDSANDFDPAWRP
jgi:Tol biopolymer transport system component